MMSKASDKIQFHYLQKGFSFSDRTKCKQFLLQLFMKEKHSLAALQYIFCGDDYLLTINKNHLQHDYYTDIITFGLTPPGTPIEAEVYISVDRVRENAENLGESFTRELHRVIFHGALHLCGYRDKSNREEKLMRQMEDHYLGAYFN